MSTGQIDRWTDRRAQQDDRGMVTAELAVATLAALALLTMLCWGIFLLVMQLRIIDTAGEVARQAARQDSVGVTEAKEDAPPGAQVRVTTADTITVVEVRLTARPFADWLVAVPLQARAQVITEPKAGPR